MADSDSTLASIYRFQKKLDKYAAQREIEKLLYCIHKLKYLPVTVQHLEITGVGKSINALRHEPGDIGEKAKVLVSKWKQMVSEEELREQQNEMQRKEAEQIEQQKKINARLQEQKSKSDSDENDCLHIEEDLYSRTNTPIEENGYDPKTSMEDYKNAGHSSYVPAYEPTKSSSSKSDSPSQSIPNGDVKKEDEKHKRKHHKTKSSSKHHNSSSSSSHKRKRDKSDSKDRKKDKKKHKSKSGDEDSLRDISNHSNSLDSPVGSKASSSVEDKSIKGSKEKDDKSRKSKKRSHEEASSGFEAALMGMEAPTKKKKKKKDKEPKAEKSSTSNHKTKVVKSMPPLAFPEMILPDLSDEETPTKEPQRLMADYKPLPHIPLRAAPAPESFHSRMTDEEALSQMMSSKREGRKLYTGKAFSGQSEVPSLFQSCIKVLQDNIDLLETTGNIPFDILRPVLDKATSQQLFQLEDYNPYLLDDSDCLWAAHCRKKFKNKKREEMETWRDMYTRCTDETQERMKFLTDNLSKKYALKVPTNRMTQVLHTNTFVKPPRNIARAQAKYGTGASSSTSNSKPSSSKSEESSSSSSSTSTVKYLNNQHPKPDKVPSQSRPHYSKKPKVAPLMGKARQLMKKVCRR